MEEIWREIKGYPNYMVSNLGRVKSLNYNRTGREEILKPSKTRNGYLKVELCKNGKHKNCDIHRLVAEAFLTNPDNLPQVNHKDENKENNFVYINEDGTVDLEKSNLEFCSCSYNTNYGARNKKVSEKMTNGKLSKIVHQYDLNGNFIREFPSIMEIYRQFGYDITHISKCCKGGYFDKKRNKWVNVSQSQGFIWRFKKESVA